MNKSSRFVSIGAGNVATHLAKCLCSQGYVLLQVYNRSSGSAADLAQTLNASWTTHISEIIPDADFYIIALPDQVLTDFLREFPVRDKLIFHTAGSTGLEVFDDKYTQAGVMYPLQTFSKSVGLSLTEVPFLIEAVNQETLNSIISIAGDISRKVYPTNADTRRQIHLAAIFACNFTNHMFAVSHELLRENNLDPELLRPLVDETFRKSRLADPVDVQTGPAVRNDTPTLQKHIKMLQTQPLLQKIYTFTSESIQYLRDLKHNNSVK